MDVRFDGKIALVTGGGSGIGYTTARLLAESGAKVVITGSNGEKLCRATEMLREHGEVCSEVIDITDRQSVIDGVERIRQRIGEIDVLIQCAGRGFHDGDIYENWNRSMELNATGTFQMMKEVVERSMLPRNTGSIVNIASMAGIRGMMKPLSEFGYSASKAAVTGLTRQAAVMWAEEGIRVNAVAPGGVCSGGVGLSDKPVMIPDDSNNLYAEIIPTHRLSTTTEIAAAALFLASDFSSNTTGQIMVIDGGASQIGF